jgi:hypothetical protein
MTLTTNRLYDGGCVHQFTNVRNDLHGGSRWYIQHARQLRSLPKHNAQSHDDVYVAAECTTTVADVAGSTICFSICAQQRTACHTEVARVIG